ncbi:hypothetical protein AAVH_15032 [Aphelenchoides avenae]|nr:hypothetical protein AAVH_15032 [Aphelenchus avenae]
MNAVRRSILAVLVAFAALATVADSQYYNNGYYPYSNYYYPNSYYNNNNNYYYYPYNNYPYNYNYNSYSGYNSGYYGGNNYGQQRSANPWAWLFGGYRSV